MSEVKRKPLSSDTQQTYSTAKCLASYLVDENGAQLYLGILFANIVRVYGHDAEFKYSIDEALACNNKRGGVFTCMSWGQRLAVVAAKTRKPKKSQAAQDNVNQPKSAVLAFGFNNGAVVVYDVTAKEVVYCADKNPHMGTVNAVAMSKDGNTVYSCGQDGWVLAHDIANKSFTRMPANEEKTESPYQCLAVSNEGDKVYAANEQIVCFDTANNSIMWRSAAHICNYTKLVIDGAQLLAVSPDDRTVYEFSLGHSHDAAASDVSTSHGANTMIVSSPISITVFDRETDNRKRRKPKAVKHKMIIKLSSVVATPGVDGMLCATVSDDSVALATGSAVSPSIRSVKIDASTPEVVIDIADKQQTTGDAQTKNVEPVKVIGTVHMPLKTGKVLTSENVEDDEEQGLTIQEKLAALQVQSNTKAPRVVPQADSLKAVVEQALQSNDNSLLEYCFAITDKRVVDKTVQKLAPNVAIKLVQTLSVKLQNKPTRAAVLVVWLRCALIHHAITLSSSPELVTMLTPLYQTLSVRLSSYNQLLALHGRLDLLLAQIPSESVEGGVSDEPLMSFDEKEQSTRNKKRRERAKARKQMEDDDDEMDVEGDGEDGEEDGEDMESGDENGDEMMSDDDDDKEEEGDGEKEGEDDDDSEGDDDDDEDEDDDAKDDKAASDGEDDE